MLFWMMLFSLFQLLSISQWPFLVSLGSMVIFVSLIVWFKFFVVSSIFWLFFSLVLSVLAFFWWADVILEGLSGQHSFSTLDNLKLGMILFIMSEVWFFFGFFWSYFHYSLTPNIEVGNIFPPFYCLSFNPFSIPLLNTLVLLSSGITVTVSHHNMINNLEGETSLLFTIILGMYFTVLQGFEYITSSFTICDSVFGSIFFITTGFHGLHVLIGSSFLLFCLIRMLQLSFSSFDHLSYEFAIWYWHFVDVVWLFLFSFIYYWGA